MRTVGRHQGDVGIVPSAIADIVGDDPSRVGTPLIVNVAIGIREDIFAVHKRLDSMALHVYGLQRTTILDKRHRLTVGAELWHKRRTVALHDLFLHQVAGIGKLFLLGIFDLC